MSEHRIRVCHKEADHPADLPTPECLLDRLPQLRAYLSRRSENFSSWVIELAIDRVKEASLPYLDRTKKCKLRNEESRRRWIFKAALKAAKQVADRERRLDILEPGKLNVRPARDRSADGDEGRYASLYAAIDLLTPLQKDVIAWFLLNDFSLQKAATAMRRSKSTVENLLKAALKRLRSLLE